MLIDHITETAKECLVKDGVICPVFFLTLDEKVLISESMVTLDRISNQQLNGYDGKTNHVFIIGYAAALVGANRAIMVWDAAFRVVENNNAPYDITQSPLTYPKSMRTECILINEVHFPSGKDRTIIVPYKGGEGEPVEFLPRNMLGDTSKMEFSSRFTSIMLNGYKQGLLKKNWRVRTLLK